MLNQSGNNKSIGLLTAFTPEIFKSEYFSRIISGVTVAARQTDYDLKLIMIKDEEYADPKRDILQENKVDGLILLTWTIHPRYVEESEKNPAFPIVIINDFKPGLKTNVVYCNNKVGIRLAFKHLINRGYKKIGMLQAPDEDSLDAKERYHAYRELLGEFQLPFEPSYFRKCDYFFEEDGYLKMMDMIHHEKSLPRALLCFNDDIAIGALKALKESHIKCPNDMAVVGYDGIDKSKYVDPPLTVVQQPLEVMGREMVHLLIGLIEGKLKPPVQKEFMPQLIIRQSS